MNEFRKWANQCPCWVTRNILASLYEKYLNGDKAALFGKMRQLEESECYSLCYMFKSLFDYVGINDEYLKYEN